MCNRDAMNSGEEDARFLAPLLTVAEAGRNLLVSPSTIKDWKTRELVHSVASRGRGAPTLPLAGVAEAQVLRGLRLSGLPPAEITRVTRSLREELGEYALMRLRLRSYRQANADVILDPRFGYGKPVFERTKVRTKDVMRQFLAGERPEDIASDYGLTEDEVLAAVRVLSGYRGAA